ncbi:MAG: leucine-rich repeat domain-containing protein, partial [Alistipes sp.]
MKKTFLSGLLLFVAAVTLSNCSKDETTDPTLPSHFPDPKFRAELVATYNLKLTSDQTDIDVNNEENKKLFANTTKLEVQQKEITTLQGIEYFTALTYLDCDYNQLTSLDVSKNTMLIKLYCSENQLTSLDVSKNTALIKLYCSENQLTSLDVTKNTALTEFACSDNQ